MFDERRERCSAEPPPKRPRRIRLRDRQQQPKPVRRAKPAEKKPPTEVDAFGYEVPVPKKDTRYAMRLLQQDQGAWGGDAADPGALG